MANSIETLSGDSVMDPSMLMAKTCTNHFDPHHIQLTSDPPTIIVAHVLVQAR
jgi:hypothetical protein